MQFQVYFPVLKRSEVICSYGGDVSLPASHRH